MPNLASTITGFVKGDDLDIVRTVTNIPTGQVLSEARLTVRSPDLSTIIFSKVITSTPVAGAGSISDTGADGTGVLTFQLTGGISGNTVSLTPQTNFPFDIQLKTDANKHYTPEVGTITAVAEVTLVD
jgi:hypothetical protein